MNDPSSASFLEVSPTDLFLWGFFYSIAYTTISIRLALEK